MTEGIKKGDGGRDPDRKEEEEEERGVDLLPGLLSLLLSPDFLAECGRWRDGWRELEKERLTLARAANDKAHRRTLTFVWLRYALSAFVVGAITYLGYIKVLESQALIALLGGVVGSLFVQPGAAISGTTAPPRLGVRISRD